MKVSELIEELKKMPQDADVVFFEYYENHLADISKPDYQKIAYEGINDKRENVVIL